MGKIAAADQMDLDMISILNGVRSAEDAADRMAFLRRRIAVRRWRKSLADSFGIPAYAVFKNDVLDEIAEKDPGRVGDLLGLDKTFPEGWLSAHADGLLAALEEARS